MSTRSEQSEEALRLSGFYFLPRLLSCAVRICEAEAITEGVV